ncbi:MAG: serine/threonine-protein kinase [Polyangiales bacterium]
MERVDGGTFGQYLLKERIAQGGMAEIFAAERLGAREFRREVCIKRILPGQSRDRAFVEMFIDEARICSRLRHSNIVSIDDFGEIDGRLFACMEWVNGVDASKVLRAVTQQGRTFPVDAAFFLAAEVLRALEYAHGKRDGGRQLQIVHRDVSPHNVLVSYLGEVKLTDFGIARATTRLHQTQGDLVKGKLAYMAPEQALGKSLDGRVDLFAVGVMLYELLAGRRPYGGAHHDIVLAAIQGQRTPIRALRPEMTEAQAAVLDRLLEADVERRWPNASEAIDAIAALSLSTGERTLSALMAELYPNQGSVVTPRVVAPTPIQGAASLPLADTISLAASEMVGPNGTAVSPPAPAPVAYAPPAPAAPPAPPQRLGVMVALGTVAFFGVMSTVALGAYTFAQSGAAPPPAPVAAPIAAPPSAPPSAPLARPELPAEPIRAPIPEVAPAPPPAVAPAVAPAQLSVVPMPWGRVTVDGRAVATRQWVSLPPGPHRVVVRQDGGRSASRTVTLAPGQRLSLTVPVR